MPRTKEQNEAMRLETQQKIQRVSTKLFAEKGFTATRVQQIADAAGISVGLMYRHYKTKDDIFGSLVEQAIVGFAEMESLFSSGLSPIEIMTLFINEVSKDISTGDDFVHFMLLLNQPFVSNEHHAWMDKLWDQRQIVWEQIETVIEHGQSEGLFRTGDAREMLQYLFSTILGICMMKKALREHFVMPSTETMMAFLI